MDDHAVLRAELVVAEREAVESQELVAVEMVAQFAFDRRIAVGAHDVGGAARRRGKGFLQHGAIADEDLNLVMVTDDLDAAMAHLVAHTVEPFGLKRRRPRRWLGERVLIPSAGSPTPPASPSARP